MSKDIKTKKNNSIITYSGIKSLANIHNKKIVNKEITYEKPIEFFYSSLNEGNR